MPTYDYRCPSGHRYEKREPFGSPAQQPCERCDKQAQRVLTSPTIVFKGSGWYKTDSRGSNSKIGTDRDSGDSESKTVAKAEEAESKKAETASKKAEKTGSKTSAKTASPTSKKTSGATPSKAKSSSSSASKNGGSGSSSTKSGSD